MPQTSRLQDCKRVMEMMEEGGGSIRADFNPPVGADGSTRRDPERSSKAQEHCHPKTQRPAAWGQAHSLIYSLDEEKKTEWEIKK